MGTKTSLSTKKGGINPPFDMQLMLRSAHRVEQEIGEEPVPFDQNACRNREPDRSYHGSCA